VVNHKKQAIKIEVTRSVLGKVSKAGRMAPLLSLVPQDWERW